MDVQPVIVQIIVIAVRKIRKNQNSLQKTFNIYTKTL